MGAGRGPQAHAGCWASYSEAAGGPWVPFGIIIYIYGCTHYLVCINLSVFKYIKTYSVNVLKIPLRNTDYSKNVKYINIKHYWRGRNKSTFSKSYEPSGAIPSDRQDQGKDVTVTLQMNPASRPSLSSVLRTKTEGFKKSTQTVIFHRGCAQKSKRILQCIVHSETKTKTYIYINS